MKKNYRVKREDEFQHVFKQGVSSANRQFVIYVLEKPDQPHFRVGISVGKRIGNAVARNWVKRRIRQTLTNVKNQIRSDIDFLVIARPSVSGMEMAQVQDHLLHALKVAKVLKVVEAPQTGED